MCGIFAIVSPQLTAIWNTMRHCLSDGDRIAEFECKYQA